VEPLDARIETLEKWRKKVAPMLRQLAQDQEYRARWNTERARRWSRWQRRAAFVFASLGATAVVADALVGLVHLF
jgi:type VI protein secretion system component VasF